MRNIILLDDEQPVRDGLATMIHSARKDWRVAAGFPEGGALLAALSGGTVQADLIIADVRMPGMSGIEFIQKLRELGYEMEIIFLSGYSEFEYARQALLHHAFRYLLKPLDEGELFEALDEVGRMLDRNDEVFEAKPGLSHLMAQALIHPAGGEPEKLELLMQHDAGADVCILANLYNENPPIDSLAAVKIRQAACATLAIEASRILSFCQDSRHLLLLISVTEKSAEDVFPCLQELIKSFRLQAAGVSGVHRRMASLYKMNAEAKDALGLSMLLGPGVYCHSRTAAAGEGAMLSNRLIDALVHGDRARANASFEQIQASALMNDRPAGERLCLLRTIGQQLMQYAAYNTDGLQDDKAQLAAPLLQFEAFASPQSYLQALKNTAESFVKASAHKMERLQDLKIQKALRYIQAHFAQDLSLSLVAAQIDLNPNYFGNLFSRLVGRSFTEYVIDCRLAHATDMLCHTSLKMYEIAEKTGFCEAKYFTRLFKQRIGMSPLSYRLLAQKLGTDGGLPTP